MQNQTCAQIESRKSSVRGGEAALPRASGVSYGNVGSDSRTSTMVADQRRVTDAGKLSMVAAGGTLPQPTPVEAVGESDLRGFVHASIASKATSKRADSEHGSTTSSQRCRELEQRLAEQAKMMEQQSKMKI